MFLSLSTESTIHEQKFLRNYDDFLAKHERILLTFTILKYIL